VDVESRVGDRLMAALGWALPCTNRLMRPLLREKDGELQGGDEGEWGDDGMRLP
jgi:hypothetical protein